jgi:hypothetical protein
MYSLLVHQARKLRRFLAFAVGLATVVLCLGCSVPPAQGSIICQLLLPQKEATTILQTGKMRLEGGGLNCAYVGDGKLAIVLSVTPPGPSKTVPYLNKPGAQLVSVDGVRASWRLASSPTRTSILAFRSDNAIVQISLSPAVTGAEVKAKEAMMDVLRHGGRDIRVT